MILLTVSVMTDCFDLLDLAVALLGGGGLTTAEAAPAVAAFDWPPAEVIGRLNLLGG